MREEQPLLDVKELTVTLQRDVEIVRGVSFKVHAGKVLSIVGESGSGKSMAARAVMGLPPPRARISGSIRLNGEELVGLPERRLRHINRPAPTSTAESSPTRSWIRSGAGRRSSAR